MHITGLGYFDYIFPSKWLDVGGLKLFFRETGFAPARRLYQGNKIKFGNFYFYTAFPVFLLKTAR